MWAHKVAPFLSDGLAKSYERAQQSPLNTTKCKMPRPDQDAEPNDDRTSDVSEWSVSQRAIVSCLVAFHVCAVFIAPFAAPPPSSELAQATAETIRPYLRAVAIDNGYRFFAPNPAPSHLVRYEIELANGETLGSRFPDPQAHWPRLLYHRHFMLAEALVNLTIPVSEIPFSGFDSDADREQFDVERARADALLHSVAGYLLRQHPGAIRVQLHAVEHAIPSPKELQQGRQLDDPSLYSERLLGVFTPADLRRYEAKISDG